METPEFRVPVLHRRQALALLGATPWLASAQPLVLRSASQAGAAVKYGDARAARPGICREIAQAVAAGGAGLSIAGLEQTVPLRRLELLLSQGELDVFFCMLKSSRREQLMNFLPVPLYRVRHVLAMRMEDVPMPQTWGELRQAARASPVLVAQGSQLALKLREMEVHHVEAALSDREELQMLLRGRANMLYGQDMNLRQLLRNDKLEPLIRLGGQAFDEELQYAVVSRQLAPDKVQRLADRLRLLEAGGELARIVQRYR
jgi:ABC-type amino acid transport substrate-binding protein